MRLRILIVLICGLLVAAAPAAWTRKWTDNTGKFSVEAELVEVKGDKFLLKKPDGSVVTVPIARLSEADRRHVKEQAARPAADTQPPGGGRSSIEADAAGLEASWTVDFQTKGRPAREVLAQLAKQLELAIDGQGRYNDFQFEDSDLA